MKITVLVFHPAWNQSRVNKALATGLDQQIEVRNMYELYPDFEIDVAKEHQVPEAADRIVLQFPMYWYSSPALLKLNFKTAKTSHRGGIFAVLVIINIILVL